MMPESDEVHGLLAALVRLSAYLPVHGLTLRQRSAFGGLMCAGAPRLVRAVAMALMRHPQLFADQALSGLDLLRRQARATAWNRACCYLRALLAIAQDNYLIEQGHAMRDAQAVLAQVKSDGERPAIAVTDRHADRVLALALAFDHAESLPRARGQKRHRQLVRAQAAAAGPDGAKKAGPPSARGSLLHAGLHDFLSRLWR